MNDVVSKLYLETSKWFVTKSLQAIKFVDLILEENRKKEPRIIYVGDLQWFNLATKSQL